MVTYKDLALSMSHLLSGEKLILDTAEFKNLRFQTELHIPQVLHDDMGKDSYTEIALRQINQQLLPKEKFGKTTLWSYGDPKDIKSFRNPSGSVEVTQNKKTNVKWINELVKDPMNCRKFPNSHACNHLEHIIQDPEGNPAVDTTLHWANPPRDCKNGCKFTDCVGKTDFVYTGPIPMVVHLHGSHAQPESDGFPEAWFLPRSNTIPKGYGTVGTYYRSKDMPLYKEEEGEETEETSVLQEMEFEEMDEEGYQRFNPGYAIFQYTNDQDTTNLWYHDHTLGVTEKNAEAAGAGMWYIRTKTDSEAGLLPYDCHGNPQRLPGPPVKLGQDPNVLYGDGLRIRKKIREIPLIWTSYGFYEDGRLYPNTFFDQPNVGFMNGVYWPKLTVASDKYRFRFIYTGASAHVTLKITLSVNGPSGEGEDLPFHVIGSDQGHLPNVVEVSKDGAKTLSCKGPKEFDYGEDEVLNERFKGGLPVGIAERYDLLVDFSKLKDGDKVYMNNDGERILFGDRLDPMNLLAQMMVFQVDTSYDDNDYYDGKPRDPPPTSPYDLRFSECPDPGYPTKERNITLNAAITGEPQPFFFLGPDGHKGQPGLQRGLDKMEKWGEPISVHIEKDSTEIWNFWSWFGLWHPMHLHQVGFKVLGRAYNTNGTAAIGAYPWEHGLKDTVIAQEEYATSIIAKFDIAGYYSYHCHILAHEDFEMMLAMCVGDAGKDCPNELFFPVRECVKAPRYG